MLRNHVFHHDIALGGCCGKHKGSCLDLVRNDRVLRAMKLLHSADTDHIGSCTLDVGSHAVQEVCHINNMRLTGGVLDDRIALCHGSCHHNIDGRTYRNGIQENMTSS